MSWSSYFQGQGHHSHLPKIRVWAISPHRAITPPCKVGSRSYFTHLLSMTQGCVMTSTQGHISNVKATHTQNLCPGHNSPLPYCILIIYHTIMTQGHIAKVKVTVYTHGKNLFPDHYLSWANWHGMILHTLIVHDPGVVVAGRGICPVRTCLFCVPV